MIDHIGEWPDHPVHSPVEPVQWSVWDDENYEWIEVRDLNSSRPSYIRGPCKHLRVHEVKISDGTIVSRLCAVCDRRLPGDSPYDFPVR